MSSSTNVAPGFGVTAPPYGASPKIRMRAPNLLSGMNENKWSAP